MTFLARLRRRQPVAARWVTALFAVAWLGLALQPCGAMASHGDAGMASHGSATGEATHDCPHCPPPPPAEGDPPCGNALSCDAVGALALPSKAVDAKSADVVLPAPVPHLATGIFPYAVPLRPPCPALRWTPSSSPQQRFCSFLK
jgi:hypothetical protein